MELNRRLREWELCPIHSVVDYDPMEEEKIRAEWSAIRAEREAISNTQADAESEVAESVPESEPEEADDGADSRRSAKGEPAYPQRGLWLQARLKERAWNRNDPPRYGGPDAKTIDKILRGESVREDVLEKLAKALSKKSGTVTLLDIPTK